MGFAWAVYFVFLVIENGYCEDVTGFEIAVGGTNLVKVHYQEKKEIMLVYDTGTHVKLEAKLDSGTVLPTDTTKINEESKTILFTIDSKDILDGFGTFLLTFMLTPKVGSSEVKEIVIFHEEPITQFKIHRDRYLPLLEQVFFNVSIESGTNMETEWFLDSNDTCLIRHPEWVRNMRLNFTFTVPGTHNVTVVAANSVSRTFDSMLVEAIYRINGLTVDIDHQLSNGNTVMLRVMLTTNAQLPMGELIMSMDYGDGSVTKAVPLSEHIPTMMSEGFVLSHDYKSQGVYAIKATITSPVDEKDFILHYEQTGFVVNQDQVARLHLEVGGSPLVKLIHGSSEKVNFVYGGVKLVNITGRMDTGKYLSNHGVVVDEMERKITFPIHSHDIDTEGLGTFLVTFTLASHPPGKDARLKIVCYHEEAIGGFGIIAKSPFLPLNEDSTFKIEFDKGSNIETEWFNGKKLFGLQKHKGRPRHIKQNITFAVPGTHTVKVFARNAVSKASENMLVHVIHRLSGFKMETSKPEYSAFEPVSFILKTDETDLGNFGNMDLYMSYGDSNEESFSMCDKNTPCLSCFEIQHEYKRAGDYNVIAVLKNEIDEKDIKLRVIVHDFLQDDDVSEQHATKDEDEDDFDILIVITVTCVIILCVLSVFAFLLGGRKMIAERCQARMKKDPQKYKLFVNETVGMDKRQI